MHIKNFLDDGKLIDAKVLSISKDDILEKFKKNAQNMTALSLGSGYVIKPAVPHLVMNAFKNLAAVGIAADYDFKELGAMKAAAASAPAPGSGGGGDKPAAKVEEEKPKEEEPEEDDIDLGGGLFGDEDDY
jgi:hypothetical protein